MPKPPSLFRVSDLRFYWPLDGDATDRSGNGRNGTVDGAVVDAGKLTQSMRFDGADRIYFNQDISIFTFGFWFKMNAIPLLSTQRLLSHETTDSNPNSFSISVVQTGVNTGKIRAELVESNHTFAVETADDTVALNTWYYVSASFDNGVSGEMKLYVDGVSIGTGVADAAMDFSTTNTTLGRRSNNTDTFLDGWICEFKHYSVVLSLAEIKHLMSFGVSAAPIIT